MTSVRCLTRESYPTDEEHELYEEVSAYLQRPALAALPQSQRQLITLVLRKLLAPSTFVIAATLAGMANRLEQELQAANALAQNGNPLPDDDFEPREAIEEEWTEDEDSSDPDRDDPGTSDHKPPRPLFDPTFVTAEIQDLRRFAQLAHKVATNAKGQDLLNGLEAAFSKAAKLGAKRKAVIFTESRRTQSYLFNLLSEHGYKDQLVLMNSTNADPLSTRIYRLGWSRTAATMPFPDHQLQIARRLLSRSSATGQRS